jgi:hypothetical protein
MKIKVSVSVRQWVLPLGFAISKHMKSIYILCFGIDFFDAEEALRTKWRV